MISFRFIKNLPLFCFDETIIKNLARLVRNIVSSLMSEASLGSWVGQVQTIHLNSRTNLYTVYNDLISSGEKNIPLNVSYFGKLRQGRFRYRSPKQNRALSTNLKLNSVSSCFSYIKQE